MSDQPPQNPSPLQYAPRRRVAWYARRRNWLMITFLCIVIAAPLWWYWQPLALRAQWLYWSHRAAGHVMPAGADVSVIGPQAGAIPTTNPDYLPMSIYQPLASTQPAASYYPIAFRELSRIDGRLAPIAAAKAPVIFMGTVRRPDGTPRLVILNGAVERDSRSMTRGINTTVLPLPRWFDPLPPAGGAAIIGSRGAGSGRPPVPAAYLTATIDPRDPSHLIIPYNLLESATAVAQRVRAAARAVDPDGPLPTGLTTDPPQPTAQGELDVHLQNDDTVRFILRGPGQLPTAPIVATPQSPQQSSSSSPAAPPARGR